MMMRALKLRITAAGLCAFISCFNVAGSSPAPRTEILWDRWGVPHIFAVDNPSLFLAFGRAQMESHGNLILSLYGQARGRAAEYWGESFLQSDRVVHNVGLPKLAREWLSAQDPEFRKCLEAFIQGMNEYASQNKSKLDPDKVVVLPLSTEDMVAHTIRIVHVNFVAGDVLGRVNTWSSAGSNAWAIGPSKSKNGRAMLLANPHLPWSDFFLFYETHLNAPGVSIYGATLVGFPVIAIGFNDRLGWTHTVNTFDGADLYELKLAAGGYLFDGLTKAFETESMPLKVKAADGTLHTQPYTIRRSVQGPVVSQKGDQALALRIAGLDRPRMLQQWWDMGRAGDFKAFRAAIEKLQIPMFNIVYADRDGRTMLVHNGCIPVRSKGDFPFWYGIVPGDTSETLWNGIHAFSELPAVVDPTSGWVANSNEPPYFCTRPIAMDWKKYPPYFFPYPDFFRIAPAAILRAQRSERMLSESGKLSLDEMIALKHSTHEELADRIMADLQQAVAQFGDRRAKEAAAVLSAWDGNTEPDSRGAVLFARWFAKLGGNPFARMWEEGRWYDTPSGLKNPDTVVKALAAAADEVASEYGSMDVRWGDANRLRIGTHDFAANGGSGALGIFRVIQFTRGKDGKMQATAGDSFVAAVEFSSPVKARALLSYGNSSEPASIHRGDQLELLSKKELRPVWRTRAEIEKNLERREALP